MRTHPDFEELLRLLEEHRVDYMIVGGCAVAYHGYPRFTKDIDLFYDPSEGNIARLREALIAFAFSEQDLPHEAFTTPGSMVTFGVMPTRVDLINDIDGVSYDEARPNTVRGAYGDVEVTFIGLRDLIKNKPGDTSCQGPGRRGRALGHTRRPLAVSEAGPPPS